MPVQAPRDRTLGPEPRSYAGQAPTGAVDFNRRDLLPPREPK